MDDLRSLGKYLQARRAHVTPDQVGLPSLGRRRVPGLRREELALLAGVSVDYYTRLEQGRSTDPSCQVLTAIARALQLDDLERDHLFRLASPIAATGQLDDSDQVRPQVHTVLHAMSDTPALIYSHRLDVLALNTPARLLYEQVIGDVPVNMARYFFLDPRAEGNFPCLRHCQSDIVAQLRLTAGKYPHDRPLISLIKELMESSDFRALWQAAEVKRPHVGVTTYNHPEFGVLSLHKERFALDDGSGQELVVLTAPKGTAAHEHVRELVLQTAA
ncbi:helix-turn-helix domain-containing protein [Natronoglycomyces albus]|uniref:Helix-turn-helix domain-containing protein n=1 Tax=Natronoglycomyces albus TaxID=2811108 RepID=A0A895XSA4_9ACTN|nr:helix-turn-helix transcriptional regulator [Natronoglycomyces albus]QSB05436.1 helix-turn-helix domain-containing protein [Natronoglycomyces albus]